MAQYLYETVKPDYTRWWSSLVVTKVPEARAAANKIIAGKARYKAAEALTGIKWFVIGLIHNRESNCNFNTWLHNGDPMRNKQGLAIQTVHVTAHRPPNPSVTWEQGAYDALIVCLGLNHINDWCVERVAYIMEKMNGWGYRSPRRNIPSPYLVGGTNIQKRGKFVRDGVYDPDVMDPQLGGLAVLKMLMDLDADVRFDTPTPLPATVALPPGAPAQPPPPPAAGPVGADVDPADRDPGDTEVVSPRADDTVTEIKPITKSKTAWGGIIGWLGGMGSTFAAFFEHLDNVYTFSAFVLVLVIITVGAFLVFKGRIDVNKVVEHLAQDVPPPEEG